MTCYELGPMSKGAPRIHKLILYLEQGQVGFPLLPQVGFACGEVSTWAAFGRSAGTGFKPWGTLWLGYAVETIIQVLQVGSPFVGFTIIWQPRKFCFEPTKMDNYWVTGDLCNIASKLLTSFGIGGWTLQNWIVVKQKSTWQISIKAGNPIIRGVPHWKIGQTIIIEEAMMIAQWCCSQVKPAKAHGFHVVVSLVQLFPSTNPANIQEIIAIVFVGISTAIQMYQFNLQQPLLEIPPICANDFEAQTSTNHSW